MEQLYFGQNDRNVTERQTAFVLHQIATMLEVNGEQSISKQRLVDLAKDILRVHKENQPPTGIDPRSY